MASPSKEEPDISYQGLLCTSTFAHIISQKCSSALNTRSNDFIRRYIERVTSHKSALGVAVRDDGGVAGEGRVKVSFLG